MTSPALDLFAHEPRPGLGLSETEFATALFCCCTNRIPLTDIERAIYRVTREINRFCKDCGKRMVLVTRATKVDATCPFCAQPIPHDNTQRAMAIMAGGIGRWAHPLCIQKARGGRSFLQGQRTVAGHPDCARCGAPWDEHEPLGYKTRSCPNASGADLYERAPGVVGVESPDWLVQTHG